MPTGVFILAHLLLGQPAEEVGEQDDPVEVAQKAYNEGTVHYSAGLYDDAVASFKAAMLAAAGIDDRSYRDAVLRALHFNLARALYGRFKVSRDVNDLRQAREVLANYLRDIEVHGAERKEAKTLIDQLDAELEEIESGEKAEEAAPGAGLDSFLPENSEDLLFPEQDSGLAGPVSMETDTAGAGTDGGNKSGRPFIIAGATVGGLGLVGGSVLAGVGASRSAAASDTWDISGDYDELLGARTDGRSGNVLIGVGAGVGATLLVSGAILVLAGVKRNRAAKSTNPLSATPGGFSWRF